MRELRRIFQQATAAFEAGDYDRAESLLHEVLSRERSYANVYNMLGVIAGHGNASQKAVAMFRQALSLNPNYREAQVNLAITLAEMGAYEQAAQEIGALEERETTSQTRLSTGVLGKLANVHADLGRKYHALGLYAQAVVEFDKALELCPTFPDLHNHRAQSCRELGDLAGAVEMWERALRLNPEHPLARVYLAQATVSRTSVE